MSRQAARFCGVLARALHSASAQAAASTSAAAPQAAGRAAWAHSAGPLSRFMATNSHDVFNVHRDAPHNNKSTEFDFTPANYARAAEIISRYPPNYKQSAVIPLLDLAQQQNEGWLSLGALNRVAKVLDMPEIRVYEVRRRRGCALHPAWAPPAGPAGCPPARCGCPGSERGAREAGSPGLAHSLPPPAPCGRRRWPPSTPCTTGPRWASTT
jgi:hypothetical protein